MNQNTVKQTANYIVKEIFGVDNHFLPEKMREKFAFDIPPVRKTKCLLSGLDTWVFSQEGKFASQEAIADRFQKDEWMRKAKSFSSVKEILASWEEINYYTGEKIINSKEVSCSDGIYNSSSVYNSLSVFDSQNILYSYKIFDSNFLLGCRDDSSCTLGIRVKESLFCSTGFEISWSNKVSRSMFIHDGFDLYECLFCSHLRSKRYCVANMQFEKEEYSRLKKLVIDWVLGK